MDNPHLVARYANFCDIRARALKERKLDLSRETFMFPTTILPLVAFIESNPGIKIIPPKDPNLASYFNKVRTTPLDSAVNQSFVPIIQLPRDDEKFSDKIVSHLKKWINPSICGGINAFASIVGELTDNIYQHSDFRSAKIMAQYYPIKKCIEFSFFDDGITIPGRQEKTGFKSKDDVRAIEEALKGLSTKPEKDRGHGLRDTFGLVVKGLGGQVLIVSRNGGAHIAQDDRSVLYLDDPSKGLKGTLISLKMPVSSKAVDIYEYIC